MISDWEYLEARTARRDEQRATPPHRPTYPVDPLSLPAPQIPPVQPWSPELAGRPVVALDLDGLLNVWHYDGQPPAGTTVVDTVIPAWACAGATYLRSHGQRNGAITITVDPAHGPWIRSLLDRGVDVVWSTTWESAANVVYAPLLGIPPLPVVPLVSPPPHHKGGSPEVKCLDLALTFPGRPVVWLDDHSQYLQGPGHNDLRRRPGFWPTLIPRIYPDMGLTQQVRDEVDAWLAQGPVAGSGRLSACDFDDLLDIAFGGDWRTPLRARIRARNGVLALFGRGGHWSGRPSAGLRERTGLPASVSIHGFPDSTGRWVTAGESVTVSVSPAHGSDRGHVRAVELGTVFGIDVVDAVPLHTPSPWQLTRAVTNVAAQKQLQQIAEETAARFGDAGDAAVKPGWGASVWDSNTALEITTNGETVTVTANTSDGKQLPDGRPTYGWVEVHFGKAPHWLFMKDTGRGRGHDLDPGRGIEFAITMWRRWQTQRTCDHNEAGVFCPTCGARCDGSPW
ncbi:MAG: hypothetical protein WCP28_19885 [Actinomycetes bacterium]